MLFAIRTALILALAAPAAAQERLPDLGGFSVEVSGETGEQTLIVGNDALLTAYMIEVEAIEDVAGVPVLVGYAFAGGNACAGSHFVVALEGGAPRLSGPLDSCMPETRFALEAERVRFWTEPMPAAPGLTWTFTPEAGLEAGAPVAFAPDANSGWDALASLQPGHPADILGMGGIAAEIDALLGADRAVFIERISDLGSGGMEGADFFGTACLKFTCPEDNAMLFLDGGLRRPFLAWREAGGPPRQAPDASEWSPAARGAYERWLSE
jgi:hypothetical protein